MSLIDQEQRQLRLAALDLRQACRRMLDASGGSEQWSGATAEHLLIIEGALLTTDNETLLAGCEHFVKWMDAKGDWNGETEAALIDMKTGIASAYPDEEEAEKRAYDRLFGDAPNHADDEPDDYGPETLSGRQADAQADDYFAHLEGQRQ